jgi:hypothetical protein
MRAGRPKPCWRCGGSHRFLQATATGYEYYCVRCGIRLYSALPPEEALPPEARDDEASRAEGQG